MLIITKKSKFENQNISIGNCIVSRNRCVTF